MTIRIGGRPQVAEGVYPATLTRIELRTSADGEREYRRWTFDALTADGPAEVTGISSAATGPQSKAYTWIRALLGHSPRTGEEIEEGALVGRACRVVIRDKDGYADVAQVLTAKAPQPGESWAGYTPEDVAEREPPAIDADALPF